MVTIKMPFQMPIDWTLNDLLERLLPPETIWADLYYAAVKVATRKHLTGCIGFSNDYTYR